jgi:hypothetical protein
MEGRFGVCEERELLAEFGTDTDAEEYRSALLELHLHEYVRRPAYDDLQIVEIPDNCDCLKIVCTQEEGPHATARV